MNAKVKYWTELSDYDIKTAEAMLQSKRSHKKQLMESLTGKRCTEILNKAQELQKWIMKKL
jgi:hypothetical protein